ncbi:glycosyltransferase family 2 protein [Krasilnikovia sp. MM14-A1004]|uniref:glycosyltransferase family 2 protein n=1 Tax=Krasilnikovia sp. MM14-A1004 TaxID=3373541 RepID=UPI00399CDF43
MKISFVVPTRNSARTLETCLGSLRGQTHPEVEVVVIDNRSTDGTAEIGRRLAHTFEQWGLGRSVQCNRGTARSTGDVVVFVDPDMVLEPQVAAEIAAAFTADERLGALVIPERSFGEGFLARCRELEKDLHRGDSAVLRAFRRTVIEELGGWTETLTATADWDLTARARAAGVAVGRIHAWIWHDTGRVRLGAAFAQGRHRGRRRGPRPRAGRFVRTTLLQQPTRLLRHPVLTVGLATLQLTEAGGQLLGVRDSRAGHGRR